MGGSGSPAVDPKALDTIYNCIKELDLPITIFIPKCNRDSISQMLYFNSFEKTQLYLGKCMWN